ncbi:MAG: hypothetical protein FGF52_03815 [Candidatus Brockarchaeota archaeon]|nr:hypothetical protein [Candidatus Brockarchaeota archaeon]
MKKTNRRQLSVFIPSVLVSRSVNILKSIPGFEEAPVTNKHEAIRGRIGDKTVIVYHSGSIVYEESLEEVRSMLEEILYEYHRAGGTVLGSDEAGKGEALGPLVIAATALTPRQAAYLQSIGVADSKIVPEGRIRELAREIKRFSLGYSVLMITPYRFNEIFKTKKYGNLNDILAKGHIQVLKKVVSKIREKPAKVIIDKFDSSKSGSRIRIIKEVLQGLKVEAVEKGEVFPAVAAASILARDSYLKWISRNIDKEVLEKMQKKDYSTIGKEKLLRSFKICYLNLEAGKNLKANS